MLSMRLRRLYLCLSSSFIFFLRDFGRDTDVCSFAFGGLSQPVRIIAPIRKQPIGLGQVAQQRCRTGVVAKGFARGLTMCGTLPRLRPLVGYAGISRQGRGSWRQAFAC